MSTRATLLPPRAVGVALQSGMGVLLPVRLLDNGSLLGDMIRFSSAADEGMAAVGATDTVRVPRVTYTVDGKHIDTTGWHRRAPEYVVSPESAVDRVAVPRTAEVSLHLNTAADFVDVHQMTRRDSHYPHIALRRHKFQPRVLLYTCSLQRCGAGLARNATR